MSENKKFYRTRFTFEVLSEDESCSDLTIEQVLHEANYSNRGLGFLTGGLCVGVDELTPKQVAKETYTLGSEPAFFNLNDDGNYIDDDFIINREDNEDPENYDSYTINVLENNGWRTASGTDSKKEAYELFNKAIKSGLFQSIHLNFNDGSDLMSLERWEKE